jgi:hypothetical protein
MTYYNYRQNNSGGSFSDPALNVVVKANSPAEADAIAITKGIYFDPEFEIDCDCCGNRWYPATDLDGSESIPELSDWDLRWAISDGVFAQIVVE